MQCEWEEVSMIVETLMSGTQGDKAHIVYKEGKVAIDGYVFGLLFCMWFV